MLIVPRHPETLALRVDRLWNGQLCPDERVWGKVELSVVSEGLEIKAEGPVLPEMRVPKEAPIGARVEGLWNDDVIELFLVGPGHQYFELELGAGGHFLALSFDRIRHRRDDFSQFSPSLVYTKTPHKTWISACVIPNRLLPENVRALNVFVYMAGQFLSLSPLPGDKPDFHQPDEFPSATLT